MNKFSIGDYVAYVPTQGRCTVKPERTGYEEEQTFITETNTKWRIIYKDEKKVNLGYLQTEGTGVTLQGAIGFNYSEKLLHSSCEALYSKPDKRITARSMVMEDIENLIGHTNPKGLPGYGELYYSMYGSEFVVANTKSCVPDILTETKSELGYSIIGIWTETAKKLGLKHTSRGEPILRVTRKFYVFNQLRNISKITLELIDVGPGYWLATRSVANDGVNACFVVEYVDGGDSDYEYVEPWYLFRSNGHEPYARRLMRPVVSLPLSILSQKEGTADNPHTLNW